MIGAFMNSRNTQSHQVLSVQHLNTPFVSLVEYICFIIPYLFSYFKYL